MKKVFLLCALVCAGQMYGMDEQPQSKSFFDLPTDVQAILISATSYDTADDAIKAIQAISRTNKELNRLVNKEYGKLSEYDLKEFTALVHRLADKFKMDPMKIAYKFKTLEGRYYVAIPVARKYIDLSTLLRTHVDRGNIEYVQRVIDSGADMTAEKPELLFLAMHVNPTDISTEMIELLLKNGANPYDRDWEGRTLLDRLNLSARFYPSFKNSPKYEKIKQLLEDAMAKQKNNL